MSEVYRFILPDGQEFAHHGTPASLRKEHPRAVITHRQEFDEAALAAGVEQGYWVAYTGKNAMPTDQGDDPLTERGESVAADAEPVLEITTDNLEGDLVAAEVEAPESDAPKSGKRSKA